MFYLIETKEQLEKFSEYNLDRCYLEVIHHNPYCHHLISPISLIFIKPFQSRTGFILSIDHTEGLNLDINEVWDMISRKAGQIYVLNGKKVYSYPLPLESIFCIKTSKYLESEDLIEEAKYNTSAHNYFYQRYPDRIDINRIVPIAKHFEKYENLFSDIGWKESLFKSRYYKFYNRYANRVFSEIEQNPLTFDMDLLKEHFTLKNESFSITDNKIYTNYNLFTLTGRPSNKFNGINFAGMDKHNDSRKFIIPSNDLLVEFDYTSYHLKILCEMIDYRFAENDIHAHLGKMYFNTDQLTDEQHDDSKGITFKLLYTDAKYNGCENIPFIDRVRDFKDSQWKKFQELGYVSSFISQRPIKNFTNKTQVLPYILQNYETERNILIISDLLSYLQTKISKLVLYTYDSFLIDYNKHDGAETLMEIQNILEQDEFLTTCSFGKNYANLKPLISI